MRLILDTHTLLWWDAERGKLSPTALAFCQDPGNTLLVSMASLWELQIKVQTGKLILREPLTTIVKDQEANGVLFLPISQEHVYALDSLPFFHKDPFDRLILAQARVEGATLLSADTVMPDYAQFVPILW